MPVPKTILLLVRMRIYQPKLKFMFEISAPLIHRTHIVHPPTLKMVTITFNLCKKCQIDLSL